jgi:arginyl-tRNA synthetase
VLYPLSYGGGPERPADRAARTGNLSNRHSGAPFWSRAAPYYHRPVIQQRLAGILRDAMRGAAAELELDPEALPEPEMSRPRAREHGDWATNVALALAGKAGRSPREVASAIAARVPAGDVIAKVEVAGPGFINLFLGHGWLHDVVRDVLEQGHTYGRHEGVPLERVQVEFVSANPTGPLHVGTARNAAIGDSLANVLEAAGYSVEREYYFNDSGRQLELFGESVEARYLERFRIAAEIPEGGYQGDYVKELAEALAADHGDALVATDPSERSRLVLAESVERTMAGIRATLERFGIRMDSWVSEQALLETGLVHETVDRLRWSGHAYEKDGAVFFRATEFGDEKDRVLIRSSGEPTYFAKDCAYVVDKASRGFHRLIYVWGADHHGTMKRLLGAAEALGVEATLEIVLYQLVAFYRSGQPVRMSKRTGDLITLDELLDEVGPDAARYTLLSRSNDSPLDFDIDLVTRQTLDNPVYYVQYAHARIASILRKAVEQAVAIHPWRDVAFEELVAEAELDLLRVLSEFPEVVRVSAASLAPHRLTRYAEQAAAAFHRFYTECRVITDDRALTQARLWLSTAAKQVIASTLTLIGVSAPESMERINGDDG